MPRILKPKRRAIGNWKMNGLSANVDVAQEIAAGCAYLKVDVALCPPATLLGVMAQALAGTVVRSGGQDCHSAASGAHTGDIAAEMLSDCGATTVILGHSERRRDHGEKSPLIASKADAAARAGVVPIVCVGETEAEREAGRTLGVVRRQLRDSISESFDAGEAGERLVIAYEPVWAIGTGRTPTSPEIEAVHKALRQALKKRFGKAAKGISILYGGSVKASNAAEIFAIPNVDGALVGGASLSVKDFLPIVQALAEA